MCFCGLTTATDESICVSDSQSGMLSSQIPRSEFKVNRTHHHQRTNHKLLVAANIILFHPPGSLKYSKERACQGYTSEYVRMCAERITAHLDAAVSSLIRLRSDQIQHCGELSGSPNLFLSRPVSSSRGSVCGQWASKTNTAISSETSNRTRDEAVWLVAFSGAQKENNTIRLTTNFCPTMTEVVLIKQECHYCTTATQPCRISPRCWISSESAKTKNDDKV